VESEVDMKRGHAAVVAVAIGALTLALPADARPTSKSAPSAKGIRTTDANALVGRPYARPGAHLRI
jgi:hypothetical protein